jgi:hypothetical protein
MSEEARHGDSIQSPTELQCNRSSKEMEIIDLYFMGSDSSVPEKPFIHQVLFNGPNGEIVRVRGLFDNGGMVGVMDLMVFFENQEPLRTHHTTQTPLADGKRCDAVN